MSGKLEEAFDAVGLSVLWRGLGEDAAGAPGELAVRCAFARHQDLCKRRAR